MAISSVLGKGRGSTRNSYTSFKRSQVKPERAGRSAGRSSIRPSTRLSNRPSARLAQSVPVDSQSLQKAMLWLGGLACVLSVFAGLSFGLMKVYRFCTSNEYFQIDTIEVKGTQQLKTEDILALSGMHKGDNALSIHIPDIEQKLLQNPWVESVIIKRDLPSKFIIQVKERVPQFWVLKDGTLHYLDSNGLLIAPVESSNFYSLPTLDIGPGGEEALPYLSEFMENISSTSLPFELSNISWLRISAGKGFELYWENKQLSLSIGIEEWRKNIKHLALVVADMENRDEIHATREIRAANGQVWLQKS